jgi:3-methyladenine DNA glycosylase Tag
MSSKLEASDRVVTSILAGAIVVVLLGGIVGAVAVNSSDSTTDTKKSQTETVDEAERQRQTKAALDAKSVEAANAEALKSITADQELCKTKYLADAQARAAQATQQLKEQQDSLTRILAQLPPGKAKDELAGQLPLEFDTSNALVASELRAAEDRCKLAATIYQYTQAPAIPGG